MYLRGILVFMVSGTLLIQKKEDKEKNSLQEMLLWLNFLQVSDIYLIKLQENKKMYTLSKF